MVEKITRAALLGAGSAVALVGFGLMTRLVEAATGADADDIATLNAAIELERAGIDAYRKAEATNLLGYPALAIARRIAADHTAHRDALIAAVRAAGATPSERMANLSYPPLESELSILRFAQTVEEKAASTYLSVIPEFSNRKLSAAAASILGVETIHVSMLAAAQGRTAYPSGFVG